MRYVQSLLRQDVHEWVVRMRVPPACGSALGVGYFINHVHILRRFLVWKHGGNFPLQRIW